MKACAAGVRRREGEEKSDGNCLALVEIRVKDEDLLPMRQNQIKKKAEVNVSCSYPITS